MQQPAYNDISPELRGKIPQLKGNDTITFRAKSIGSTTVKKANDDDTVTMQQVYPASLTVPNTDRIFDPYKKVDGQKEPGAYVDIAYITGQAAATRKNAARPVMGSIEFLGANTGQLTLTRKEQELVNYLCLTNRNEHCVNEDGKITPKHGFMFEEVKPAENEADTRKKKLAILNAKAIIENADQTELDIMRETCGIPKVENNVPLSEDAIKNRLDDIAEQNPAKIVNASSEGGGKIRAVIRDAVKANLIAVNEDEMEWRHSDSQIKITAIPSGQDHEDALVSYFQKNKSAEALFADLKKKLKKDVKPKPANK